MNDHMLRDDLRRLDPAAGVSSTLADRDALLDHLHRSSDDLRPGRWLDRGRFRLRRVAPLGAAVSFLILVAVAIGWARTGDVQEPFASRAYAAAAPGDGAVYSRIRTRLVRADGSEQFDRTYDTWIRPGGAGFVAVSHLRDGGRTAATTVTVSTATVRTTWIDGRRVERVAGPPEPERAGVFDPDQHFRRQYEAGRVRDAGASTVDGRAARRFVMDDGDQRITYDVDARTLEPMRWVIRGRDVADARSPTTTTVTIESYERDAAVPSTRNLLRR